MNALFHRLSVRKNRRRNSSQGIEEDLQHVSSQEEAGEKDHHHLAEDSLAGRRPETVPSASPPAGRQHQPYHKNNHIISNNNKRKPLASSGSVSSSNTLGASLDRLPQQPSPRKWGSSNRSVSSTASSSLAAPPTPTNAAKQSPSSKGMLSSSSSSSLAKPTPPEIMPLPPSPTRRHSSLTLHTPSKVQQVLDSSSAAALAASFPNHQSPPNALDEEKPEHEGMPLRRASTPSSAPSPSTSRPYRASYTTMTPPHHQSATPSPRQPLPPIRPADGPRHYGSFRKYATPTPTSATTSTTTTTTTSQRSLLTTSSASTPRAGHAPFVPPPAFGSTADETTTAPVATGSESATMLRQALQAAQEPDHHPPEEEDYDGGEDGPPLDPEQLVQWALHMSDDVITSSCLPPPGVSPRTAAAASSSPTLYQQQRWMVKAIEALDKSGNEYFERGLYDEAYRRYERALLLKRKSLQQASPAAAGAEHGAVAGTPSAPGTEKESSGTPAASTPRSDPARWSLQIAMDYGDPSTTSSLSLDSSAVTAAALIQATPPKVEDSRTAPTSSCSSLLRSPNSIDTTNASTGAGVQQLPARTSEPPSSEAAGVAPEATSGDGVLGSTPSKSTAASMATPSSSQSIIRGDGASTVGEPAPTPEEKQKRSILASVATSINNMTYLKQRAGLATADETMASYLKSLQIKREILGEGHLSVGKTLNNIGSVFYLKHEYEPALTAYRNARSIMEQQLGPDHVDVGTVISNIGDVYSAMGQVELALETYRQAMQIRWTKLGPLDPKVIRLMEQMAALETGAQPFKQEGELSDSENEDYQDEDRKRHAVFKDEVKTLQEELMEDMKFFDLVERKIAIDMIKDKARIIREMRELYDRADALYELEEEDGDDDSAHGDDEYDDDDASMSPRHHVEDDDPTDGAPDLSARSMDPEDLTAKLNASAGAVVADTTSQPEVRMQSPSPHTESSKSPQLTEEQRHEALSSVRDKIARLRAARQKGRADPLLTNGSSHGYLDSSADENRPSYMDATVSSSAKTLPTTKAYLSSLTERRLIRQGVNNLVAFQGSSASLHNNSSHHSSSHHSHSSLPEMAALRRHEVPPLAENHGAVVEGEGVVEATLTGNTHT